MKKPTAPEDGPGTPRNKTIYVFFYFKALKRVAGDV